MQQHCLRIFIPEFIFRNEFIKNAVAQVKCHIIVTGSDYPLEIRILGAIALFASMTNIVSGFLITDRMLKMFKSNDGGRK